MDFNSPINYIRSTIWFNARENDLVINIYLTVSHVKFRPQSTQDKDIQSNSIHTEI